MFRVPNEHFTAIADIVGQPEAPKVNYQYFTLFCNSSHVHPRPSTSPSSFWNSQLISIFVKITQFLSQDPSDIALAVFAQVQSLNETHNKFIRVSPHQEISAVSTSICDECHQSSALSQQRFPAKCPILESVPKPKDTFKPIGISLTRPPAQTPKLSTPDHDSNLSASSDNHKSSNLSSAITSISENESSVSPEDNVLIDDDGYCEIDELRLPANFPNAAAAAAAAAELKRQSTISADSIPEETEHEIHAELVANDVDDTDKAETNNGGSHHIETNDVYDISQPISEYNATDSESMASGEPAAALVIRTGCPDAFCGVNRLAHVTSIAPAIPCHLIHNIVSALNAQMTQLIVRNKTPFY